MIRNIPFNMKNNAEKGKESVERLMEYLMDQPINPIGKVSGVLASFRVDILEDETQYEIQAELPGFIKEDISLVYEDEKYLTISANRPEPEEGIRYVCRERKSGKFERTFMVDGIRWEDSSAAFENGVLRIILPKADAKPNRKNIHIG